MILVFKELKDFFVLCYDDSTNDDDSYSHDKKFLPRVNIENYNIEPDDRNFYDQAINDPLKKIEVRKTATGQGDDYTIGCLLHYSYFDKNCKLIAADRSKKSIRC